MKVVWNFCQRELGGMKSVKEIYYRKFIWKLSEATAF